MDLTNQRRMAAQLMKCGVHRVYMNPNSLEDISEAVTRGDVKKLIKDGVIKARQKAGISNGRLKYADGQREAGKRKGHGSRKGAKFARYPRKRRWINTIRPIRRTLMEYRSKGMISAETFRTYYIQASSGSFRSVNHLKNQIMTAKAFVKLPEEGGK
jgi:large subunit ribosomal protein L19e